MWDLVVGISFFVDVGYLCGIRTFCDDLRYLCWITNSIMHVGDGLSLIFMSEMVFCDDLSYACGIINSVMMLVMNKVGYACGIINSVFMLVMARVGLSILWFMSEMIFCDDLGYVCWIINYVMQVGDGLSFIS